MITIARGDIVSAEVEALVNTVNCVGVMGRGIALQFKKAFPENYRAYKSACERREVMPGRMFVHVNGLTYPRFIINFPTKAHWRGQSHIDYIDKGLLALTDEVRRLGIKSIAVPPLGCGLGGLSWAEVRPRIEAAFAQLTAVEVHLYEPIGPPASEDMVRDRKAPVMTTSRAILVTVMGQYLAALMDPAMSLLEIQKAMYLMQETGYDLRLRFAKATYGPYAENLRHVLNAVEGHFIVGFGDGSDDPSKMITVAGPECFREAGAVLSETPDVLLKLDRLGDLLSAFASPYGMELLATVRWVATREGAANAQEAVELVHAWSDRKRMFPAQHIVRTWNAFEAQGWITARGSLSVGAAADVVRSGAI